MIVGIMLLIPAIMLSNTVYAQNLRNATLLSDRTSLYDRTLHAMTDQTSGLNDSPQIDVGTGPQDIGIHGDAIYVANFLSDTISLLSIESNLEIKHMGDISVGSGPTDIDINEPTNTLYVANSYSNSISVISMDNNTWIREIPVGDFPVAIAADAFSGRSYVANLFSSTVSVIDALNDTKIGEDIPVGDSPEDIAVDQNRNTLYVANTGSNSISVINATSNTKIGEDIPVGDSPVAIAADAFSGRLYVVNGGSNSISVISTEDNTKIGEDIPVGDSPVGFFPEDIPPVVDSPEDIPPVVDSPEDIPPVDPYAGIYGANAASNAVAVDPNSGIVYVVNAASDTVAVISNNTKIKDIPVGKSPVGLAVDQFRNALYIANFGSDGISVIEPSTNQVQAGITFKVNPFNSGVVKCDDLGTSPSEETPPFPTGQLIYVDSGSKCIAEPKEGFEFDSWEENLEGNSTQLIQDSESFSTLAAISRDLMGFTSEEPEPGSILNITRFGTFSANFKELPPPIPPEVVVNQYNTLALALFSGLLVPFVVPRIQKGRQRKQFEEYIKTIKMSNNLDSKTQKSENRLSIYDSLNERILRSYAEGKIDDKFYEILKRELSECYEEFFLQNIKSFKEKLPDNNESLKILGQIADAYTRGKITNEHYLSLKNEISVLYEDIFKSEIESLDNQPEKHKEERLKIQDRVADAYSKGRLNELHYNLLREKLSNYEKD